ncbi:dynein heavy chain 17, axonemal-like [Acyrthosiphon pisum]|uniref:Dynein heavy chain AAA 5 extension domain-containing protein n=1 Tax=Acyrthosiphon pisum TaxID=7029 RepID=A0A8R2JM38_ACYPI|nr:dynein heavy chain 17, axonemal-like [Acyrthosiphon pisum]
MRALRKLTTQKIVTEDTTLFMGLVGDLFLALDVPRTRELEFENQIRQAMVDLKLQHKNNFILKVVKQSQMSVDGSKLMILDGDIDPIMWIELLNTAVIDENKVLTLEINERIALTQTMRLPFDIPNLRSITPGTVFQAGVLYLSHTDHGWNPYVTSWIGTSDNATEKAALLVLLNKYVPICLEVLKTKFKIVTPIPEIMHKQMLCTLLDCLSPPINCPPETARDVYGTYFVFACLWAFGSAIFPDQLIDWRVEFSKWWLSGFKTITISSSGSVLNYFIDPEPKQFIP